MYIKYFFKHETPSKSEKDYKALLKEITTLDVRKISKLNLLAIYGAIKTLKDKEHKKDLNLYARIKFCLYSRNLQNIARVKIQKSSYAF
ncbi:hypothetical protein V7P26_08615 [Arcobacter cryaerophilus gv. pseudocryaerophilus]